MFNKIAPNNVYESFLNKIKYLSEEEIKDFVDKAKAMNISEDQINQGLKIIESLKASSRD